MKIFQKNTDNKGFIQNEEDKDRGLTLEGEVAMGYQHHDALWWEEVDPVEGTYHATKDNNVFKTLDSCFKNLAKVIASANTGKDLSEFLVLELGCGSGHLADHLRKIGIKTVVTVDANKEAAENSPYLKDSDTHFWARTDQVLDFVDENDQKVVFDLVISLEHLEHIHPDNVDTLLENITNHTKQGSTIIATAAQWNYGEGDHVHCNVMSADEWVRRFSEKGIQIGQCPFPIQRAGDTLEIFGVKQ